MLPRCSSQEDLLEPLNEELPVHAAVGARAKDCSRWHVGNQSGGQLFPVENQLRRQMRTTRIDTYICSNMVIRPLVLLLGC